MSLSIFYNLSLKYLNSNLINYILNIKYYILQLEIIIFINVVKLWKLFIDMYSDKILEFEKIYYVIMITYFNFRLFIFFLNIKHLIE